MIEGLDALVLFEVLAVRFPLSAAALARRRVS